MPNTSGEIQDLEVDNQRGLAAERAEGGHVVAATVGKEAVEIEEGETEEGTMMKVDDVVVVVIEVEVVVGVIAQDVVERVC
jgi:hypothetical protein